jgi:endoglucanase
MLGYYTLLRHNKSLPSFSKAIVAIVNSKILHVANNVLAPLHSNAFNTVMGGNVKDFIWGSSSVAANQGIVLINAYFITKDKKYIDGALSNVDYLLGRNATGYSFLTGIGYKQVMRPHHRPSIADKVYYPVPGLLSGGPHPG